MLITDWAINMAKWCNGIKKQGSSFITSYLWNHLQQNSLKIALPFLYFYLVFIIRIRVIKKVTGIKWFVILRKRSRIIKQVPIVWQVAGFIKTGYPFYKYFVNTSISFSSTASYFTSIFSMCSQAHNWLLSSIMFTLMITAFSIIRENTSTANEALILPGITVAFCIIRFLVEAKLSASSGKSSPIVWVMFKISMAF